MTTSRPTGALAAPAAPPARLARLLAVVLLLVGVLATVAQVVVPARGAAASTETSVSSVPSASRDGAVTAELVGSAPTVARPGDTVTLTVEVTNGTDAALDGAELDLGVSWRPLTSREDLAEWVDGDSGPAANQLAEPVDRLGPGESERVRLELDVDALGLGADAPWGPREMSVALTRGGASLDVIRTFLLFAPDDSDPDPVSVSVVAPVTGPEVDPLDPDAYASQLGTRTADDGRLSRLLDAAATTADSPGLSLAVDPALVAAAESAEDTDTQAWAARLTGRPAGSQDTDQDAADEESGDADTAETTGVASTTAAAGPAADVAVLPGFDPDLAAVAHADPSRADAVAATSGEAALGAAWQRPEGWDLTLGWPQGLPDTATMATARDASVDQVLVPEGLAPENEGVPASARTAVETPSGKVSALVADGGLSRAFASLTDGDDAPTSTEAAQRVLADAALLAVQQEAAGGEGVHVLAALSRTWSPDPELVAAVLGALDDAAWADVVPLSDTVAAPASRVERHSLPRDRTADTELAPASVRRLLDAHNAVAAFSTVTADPVELSGDVDQHLLGPLAVAGRAEPEVRAAAVDFAVEQAGELRRGITVADRSDVTLVSDTGKLPVMVANDLPVDATVTVVLRPDDPRLVVESRPTVVVPAGTSTNVHVPVRAIGSGDVELQVEVLAPSGSVVSGPTSFAVRVRAGWETVGTAVVAAAVAVLFLGGIWRTVRRGRSSARTTGEGVAEAADPLPRDDAPDPPDGAPDGEPGAGTPPDADRTIRPHPAKATETDAP